MRKLVVRMKSGSSMAEFPMALFIFFFLGLVPLLDLMNLSVAAASVFLTTNGIAARVATQQTYDSALNSMVQEALQFQGSGFARFSKLQPISGYENCGSDLYVVTTSLGTRQTSIVGPNEQLQNAVDQTQNIYEVMVKSTYSINPFIAIRSVPFVCDIPGLGKPFLLSCSANHSAEFPTALSINSNSNNNNTGATGGAVVAFARAPAADGPATGVTTTQGWREPGIFTEIENAGRTVVSINVVVVSAEPNTTSLWVDTGLTIQPGQQVWVDTRADGNWGPDYIPDPGGSVVGCDANGGLWDPQPQTRVDLDYPNFALLAYVGDVPPTYNRGHVNDGVTGDPRFLYPGNTMLNRLMTNTGRLWMICNEDGTTNRGEQLVRIIITQ